MFLNQINYKNFLGLIFVFVSFYSNTKAQIVFVPENNGIYEYLDRLYAKGIIDYNGVLKPISRRYIAEKLNEATKKISEMNKIEKEELEFYKKEYAGELKVINREISNSSLNYVNFGNTGRFRFLSYYDSSFSINADPIIGYETTNRGKKNIVHGRNGFTMHGYFNDYLGFNLYFYDNTERGDIIDNKREFSELTGYSFLINRKNGIDYDDVNASITYNWKWGNVSIMKDYLKWGSGRSGQIILSDKAPSIPMINLSISPTNWLKFDYILGYLNSNVVDSSTMRHNVGDFRVHYQDVSKYIAAHMLSIKPFQNLNLSLGESVVFSDKFEPIYLIPILFFRITDHNTSADQKTSGNAQLFGDISYRLPSINSVFYGSIFIDELSISDNDPSAIGYTIGSQIFDPFIIDFDFNIEYTRINPFVYFHVDDAQGYTNYDYQMGHWIGSNGDQIYLSMTKSFMRGLKLNAYWEYIRKGQKESHKEPRYQPWQTFLYGLRTNYTYFGIGLHYEIIHTLFAKLDYKYSKIESQQKDLTYKTEKYNDFTIGLSYGL